MTITKLSEKAIPKQSEHTITTQTITTQTITKQTITKQTTIKKTNNQMSKFPFSIKDKKSSRKETNVSLLSLSMYLVLAKKVMPMYCFSLYERSKLNFTKLYRSCLWLSVSFGAQFLRMALKKRKE